MEAVADLTAEIEKGKLFTSAADEVMLLPRRTLAFIASASADELRVLIYLFGNGGEINLDEAAAALKTQPQTVEAALNYWRGAKVIANFEQAAEKKASAPKRAVKLNTMQIYDPELLADSVDDDQKFGSLVDHVADRFEKGTLNKNDINSLYYLYDFINIPAELICGIVEYCAENNRKSINYLIKTAIDLYEEQEIDTYDKLENYLNARRAFNDATAQFRKLAGIADRGLTSNEKKMFALWFEERAFPFDMVAFAYEITVDNLQKFNINYLNSILERWFTEGITTLEQAKEDLKSYKEKHKKFDNQTYDFDDFFNAALTRQ